MFGAKDGDMKDGQFCPLVKGPCMKAKCAWYTKVSGQHPQENRMVDEYGCAVSWGPVLILEVARQQRGMTAATESYRNETVGFFNAFAQMINKLAGRKQLGNEKEEVD